MSYLTLSMTNLSRNCLRTRLYTTCVSSNFSSNHIQFHPPPLSTIPSRQFSQSTGQSLIESQTGIFKFLSESVPVSYFQDFVLNVHSYSCLPWWASVILTTVILRSIVTVPLAIYQNYILAKVENLTLEMPEIVAELKKETAIAMKQLNWDEKTARFMYNRSLKKQWQNLIVRDNCHPFKASVVIWAQIPMWLCLSISFRNICYMLPKTDVDAQITWTELMYGGTLWFPNLLEPDSTFILPVALGLVNLLIIEIQTASRKKDPTKLQRYIANFFRGLSIFMIPISAYVPSCLCLYWLSSSTFGLAQNLILMSPTVKRFTGIPKTPSEIQNPYLFVADKLKTRFRFKKNVHNT